MSNQPAPNGPLRSAGPKVSVPDIAAMKSRGERITMVTVYDAPGARLADAAGVDVALVGDSAAMTVLGYDSTLPVSMDEMLMLTRAVTRGATRPLIVADMPFGSFQPSDDAAVQNAVRFLKEGGADAVKIEGAGPMLRRAEAIVDASVPLVGHIGLTPQSVKLLGGYKAQGRTAVKARRLVDAARALERAGCFAIVLEAIPPAVAAFITKTLRIPTIGIGAGAACDGQVLVWHDLLGITHGASPRFVKRYAEVGPVIQAALEAYVADVRAGRFPEDRHTYAMPDHELDSFEAELMAPSADEDD